MKLHKSPLRFFWIFAPLLASPADATHQNPPAPWEITGYGIVTRIVTGWNSDSFFIQTSAPAVNPAHCQFTDGYSINISHPGYKTQYQAAMLAFTLEKPVSVAVSGTECWEGRPRIWGIYVLKQ